MLPTLLFLAQTPEYPVLQPFHTFALTTDPENELRGNNSHVIFDDDTSTLIIIHSGSLISFYNLKTKQIEGQFSLSLHNPNRVTRKGNLLVFHDMQSKRFSEQRVFDLETKSEKYLPKSDFTRKFILNLLPRKIDGRNLLVATPFGEDLALTHERTDDDKKAYLALRRVSDQALVSQVVLDMSLNQAMFQPSEDQKVLFVRTHNLRDTLVYRLPSLKRLGIFHNHGGDVATDPHSLWGVNHGYLAYNTYPIWQGKPVLANLRTFEHYLLGEKDIQGADVSPELGLAATILNHSVSLYRLPQ